MFLLKLDNKLNLRPEALKVADVTAAPVKVGGTLVKMLTTQAIDSISIILFR